MPSPEEGFILAGGFMRGSCLRLPHSGNRQPGAKLGVEERAANTMVRSYECVKPHPKHGGENAFW